MNDLIPYTAYFLHEDGTWVQPTFWVPRDIDEDKALEVALVHVGRKYFAAFGLSEEDAIVDDDSVEDLGFGSRAP